MHIFFYFIFCFFSVIGFSQNTPADHIYKLSGNDFTMVKYKTEKNITYPVKYAKKKLVEEKSDSILYIEFYAENKKWEVFRYKIENGKPILSGWQKEFDKEGKLFTERFCNETEKKCEVYRSYSYYPGGDLMIDATYLNNKSDGYHFYYYSNGQLRQCLEFKNNKLLNVQAYFDQYGNVLDVGNFCDGEGTVNIYSMNGKLIQKKYFQDGKSKKVIKINGN